MAKEKKARIVSPPNFEELYKQHDAHHKAKTALDKAKHGELDLTAIEEKKQRPFENFFFTQDPFVSHSIPRPVLLELIEALTFEIKARGVLSPFILLSFRPECSNEELKQLVNTVFPIGRKPMVGDELYRELRLVDVYTLAGTLKWCWCRMPGGVVTWKCYNQFRQEEADSGYRNDAFGVIIPRCIETESHAKIVYNFFDLMASIATHGRRNGLGARKLCRLAGFWAFDMRSKNTFSNGLSTWSEAAEATNHLFIAFLRLMEPPEVPGSMSNPSGMPKPLYQFLKSAVTYPPKPQYEKRLVAVPMITLEVNKLSANPLVLLQRVAKTLRFDNANIYHSEDDYNTLYYLFSDPNAVEEKVTPESMRIVKEIATENWITTDHDLYIRDANLSYDLRGKTWSKFYNHAMVDPGRGIPGRPFQFYAFDKKDTQEVLSCAVPSCIKYTLPYPRDEKKNTAAFDKYQAQGHATNHDQTVTAKVSQIAIDDFFVWVWMSSLSMEQTEIRKGMFGRSVVVEMEVKEGEAGKRWVVVEEVWKQKPPPLNQIQDRGDPAPKLDKYKEREKQRAVSGPAAMPKPRKKKHTGLRKPTPPKKDYPRMPTPVMPPSPPPPAPKYVTRFTQTLNSASTQTEDNEIHDSLSRGIQTVDSKQVQTEDENLSPKSGSIAVQTEPMPIGVQTEPESMRASVQTESPRYATKGVGTFNGVNAGTSPTNEENTGYDVYSRFQTPEPRSRRDSNKSMYYTPSGSDERLGESSAARAFEPEHSTLEEENEQYPIEQPVDAEFDRRESQQTANLYQNSPQLSRQTSTSSWNSSKPYESIPQKLPTPPVSSEQPYPPNNGYPQSFEYAPPPSQPRQHQQQRSVSESNAQSYYQSPPMPSHYQSQAYQSPQPIEQVSSPLPTMPEQKTRELPRMPEPEPEPVHEEVLSPKITKKELEKPLPAPPPAPAPAQQANIPPQGAGAGAGAGAAAARNPYLNGTESRASPSPSRQSSRAKIKRKPVNASTENIQETAREEPAPKAPSPVEQFPRQLNESQSDPRLYDRMGTRSRAKTIDSMNSTQTPSEYDQQRWNNRPHSPATSMNSQGYYYPENRVPSPQYMRGRNNPHQPLYPVYHPQAPPPGPPPHPMRYSPERRDHSPAASRYSNEPYGMPPMMPRGDMSPMMMPPRRGGGPRHASSMSPNRMKRNLRNNLDNFESPTFGREMAPPPRQPMPMMPMGPGGMPRGPPPHQGHQGPPLHQGPPRRMRYEDEYYGPPPDHMRYGPPPPPGPGPRMRAVSSQERMHRGPMPPPPIPRSLSPGGGAPPPPRPIESPRSLDEQLATTTSVPTPPMAQSPIREDPQREIETPPPSHPLVEREGPVSAVSESNSTAVEVKGPSEPIIDQQKEQEEKEGEKEREEKEEERKRRKELKRAKSRDKPLPLDPKWNEVKNNLNTMREQRQSKRNSVPVVVQSPRIERQVSPDEYYDAVIGTMRRPSLQTGEHVKNVYLKNNHSDTGSVASDEGRAVNNASQINDDMFSSFSTNQFDEPFPTKPRKKSSSSSSTSPKKRQTIAVPSGPPSFDPINENSVFRAARAGLFDQMANKNPPEEQQQRPSEIPVPVDKRKSFPERLPSAPKRISFENIKPPKQNRHSMAPGAPGGAHGGAPGGGAYLGIFGSTSDGDEKAASGGNSSSEKAYKSDIEYEKPSRYSIAGLMSAAKSKKH